ncbi:protein S40-2-like [Silene latifolia]|uniref:protein S40-2-like n=1 Tax=Silene latifolia TaxID=37657 RepID=UPI003D780DDF
MDFDEFQESDFMFSDYSSDQSTESSDDNDNNNNNNNGRNGPGYKKSSNGSSLIMLKSKKSIPKVQRQRRSISSSLPINIPLGNNSFRYDDDDDVECSELFDEDYSDDNEDQWSRIPPHLIVERRFNGEMARSFSPLKGRNLCEVRNSILRLTGFLER